MNMPTPTELLEMRICAFLEESKCHSVEDIAVAIAALIRDGSWRINAPQETVEKTLRANKIEELLSILEQKITQPADYECRATFAENQVEQATKLVHKLK